MPHMRVASMLGYLWMVPAVAVVSAAVNASEPLFPISIRDKYGYIDKRGNTVIEPRFSFARPFRNGLAYVVVGRGGGYLKPNGEFVWRSESN